MRYFFTRYFACFIILFAVIHPGNAQHANSALLKSDSLLRLLRGSSDSVYIRLCVEISEAYTNEKKLSLGFNYLDSALARAQSSHRLRQEGYVLNCYGNQYNYISDTRSAIGVFEKALRIYEQMHFVPGQVSVYINKGNTYFNNQEFAKAEKSYRKALQLYQSAPDDSHTEADVYNNVGSACGAQEKYDEAEACFRKALAINQQNKDYISMSYSYNNLAVVMQSLGNDRASLSYMYQALPLKMQYGTLADKADANRGVAEAYRSLGKQDSCIAFLLKSMTFADTAVYNGRLKAVYDDLAQAYTKTGRYKEANAYYNLLKHVSTELSQREMASQIEQNDVMIDFVKGHITDSLAQAARIAGQQQQIERSNTLRTFLVIIVAMIVVFSLFLFRRYRQSQAQKKEIEAQKHLVDEKQKEIVDSITYAKRLQDAILPPPRMLAEALPGHFILYLPKDIVAGDFYWLEKRGDYIFIAAADSTGHGVPGAMVSVVCSNALSRCVKEFGLSDTGAILDKARELVLDTFSKSESEIKDGMDISLCRIRIGTGELQWSGANNPLWHISNGVLQSIKPDKQPVGHTEAPTPFTTHTLSLPKDSMLYLFTDGFADQFGGKEGKKFKYRRLEESLLAMWSNPLAEQRLELTAIFDNWKGPLEQVDDVCVIGIRI